MKAAGSKFVNDVLLSKRGGAHDLNRDHKKAKRAKQKDAYRREVREHREEAMYA